LFWSFDPVRVGDIVQQTETAQSAVTATFGGLRSK